MAGSELDPEFLAKYWQKKPCSEPFAMAADLPRLTPDEVAWLATQPDVESRLVRTERTGDSVDYVLENGPFSEEYLGALPDRDWTLLVQDVDKHLPDFMCWFDMVRMIPRWRVDDLMVSIAAPGGSVGPHCDNYDVFLCQVEGSRRWALAEPGAARPAELENSLSLLEPFEASQSIAAGPGHVLYVPPRFPHWGVAETLCMTYSIGFRAPTAGELGATATRIADIEPTRANAATFYSDRDLASDEAQDCLISDRTIGRVRDQGLLDDNLSDLELARIFGMTVTDPKPWLDPDPVPAALLDHALSRNKGCRLHGMAQLAMYRHRDEIVVFLNGRECFLPAEWEEPLLGLSQDRSWSGRDLQSAMALADGPRHVAWMREAGLFDFEETPE